MPITAVGENATEMARKLASAFFMLVVVWTIWIASDLRAYLARRKGLSARPNAPSANGTQ